MAPDFLTAASDVDTVHQKMLDNIPDDQDKSQGSYAWEYTRPTAIEKAEMAGYELQETIKLIFPDWSYDSWLDLHAATRGMTRKAAVPAAGMLTITGTPGTPVAAGKQFSTQATEDAAAVVFYTNAAAAIGADGTASVAVTAVDGGADGNVPAGAITLTVGNPISGVASVTNAAATEGGTDAESDDDLIARIDEYDRTQGVSFVGSPADYIRWAKEVAGVGAATFVRPADGSGLVTLVITDSAGNPASSDLLTAVYNHIMSPDNDDVRLAPVGATLSVTAPTVVSIAVAGTVVLDGTSAADATTAFEALLKAYYPAAVTDRVLRYNRVTDLLLQVSGVQDFSGVTINGGTANITIGTGEMPVTGSVELTEA